MGPSRHSAIYAAGAGGAGSGSRPTWPIGPTAGQHAVAFKSMLRRRGVRVVSITEHADDSPTGKLMEAIIESVDEFYSENLAQEVMSGEEFRRVQRVLQAKAPSKIHPRRATSPYLLSGLAKCQTCRRALTAAEAKSGRYTYYVCQSLIKRGRGSCDTPRLNAKNFERLIIEQLREHILTESNIRALVRLVDEEMDGVAREQRIRLETIEGELAELRRRMDRLWYAVETSDLEINDILPRLKEHQERQERLETAADEARRTLSERRAVLDSVDAIAAFAEEMSDFLRTSELTESRTFIRSFVKEVAVKPGTATIRYTIPPPPDSPIGGADTADISLSDPIMRTERSGWPKATVLRTFELAVGL
ncbi:MAG: recombinase zinc beta ribbon domain-containing protein [Chloroflexi bacterium]|nr:recombinase zinc beta ribbon domain-containing protein [Chloroflexota bacterium]